MIEYKVDSHDALRSTSKVFMLGRPLGAVSDFPNHLLTVPKHFPLPVFLPSDALPR